LREQVANFTVERRLAPRDVDEYQAADDSAAYPRTRHRKDCRFAASVPHQRAHAQRSRKAAVKSPLRPEGRL